MILSKWNARNLYFYLVCFMSLVLFIFGTVQGVRNALDILYPDPPYIMSKFDGHYEKQIEEGKMTREEAEKIVQDEQELELQRNKIRNIKSLAQNIILLVISIPLFFVHWRRVANQNE